MTTLSEAKKKFEGEWIAFLIQENEKNGDTLGQILEHDSDKRKLHKKLRKRNVKDAYITFSGPIVKPGYEVLF